MDDEKKSEVGAALVVLVLGAGAAIYMYASRAASPVAPPSPAPVAAPSPAPVPNGPPLPALAEADAPFRADAAGLSADPRWADALKSEDLIPRLVSAARLIGAGRVPTEAFQFLAPRKRFAVRTKGGATVVDPKSWSRYDAAAALVASVDAKAAAVVLRKWGPRLSEAIGERGVDGVAAVRAALDHLSAAPRLTGDEPLKARDKGIGWAYADSKLEGLSPAQKQLLRAGPANEDKIQAKARELSAALADGGTK